ncbi:LysR family transcriptional regulator [Methylopila jiangsuensis]|uniref:LysR family transcriptional regulator n=1 Tax=Methylopila jiangsuensis TaxID=586230 RepID=A0A9W6N4H7_9HYPH|nr:LysR family transcriptional regulator [Methylopila jiangsuensis]MDR6286417.1 DNA-binding transcriptional LysR family regulator [Methylopila jiangsuensis]GLK77246.1 LysR family transcriptional regulator [Methylopila jiangsuensis]
MNIDHANLSRLDLNLLVAFDALVTERSVTRAAARVGLGQSAMSHALARLRTMFGDELLIRGPQGMRVTPRAQALIQPARAALAQIQEMVARREAFDPATEERTFTIGMPDSTEVLLMPKLIALLRKEAPGVRLLLRTIDRIRILQDLDQDRVDLGIGLFEDGELHHKRRLLQRESYLCIFNPELIGVTPPISLEDYVRLPHVLTSLVETPHGVVDDALAKIGLSRDIALTSPRFTAAPFVVKQAPVIATMHARVARYFAEVLDLAVSPAPVLLPDVAISMLWHASYDADPGHRWLRETILKLSDERPPSLNLWLSKADDEGG